MTKVWIVNCLFQLLTSDGKFERSFGAVAQLGERSVRNAEVVGSIPIGSTLWYIVLSMFLGSSGVNTGELSGVSAEIQT